MAGRKSKEKYRCEGTIMTKGLSNSEKLCAIARAAGNSGISYGRFLVGLTAEDKEQIYMEYEQLLERRRQEETERLQRAKEAKLLSKNRKKENVRP